MAELVYAALHGERRSLSRLLSLVEDDTQAAEAAFAAAMADRPAPAIAGFTGPAGVGKSTLIDRLLTLLRERGRRPAVVAVDPTSPLTGGALLGDRVRMQGHAADPGIFIRSVASRGRLGGLAAGAGRVARVLGAAGFDPVLIETLGAGQADTEVASVADTVVLVLAPGFGDEIQASKAGLLEVADVVCLNRADQPGAQEAAALLRRALEARPGGPPLMETVATTGRGVGELWEAVAASMSSAGAGGGA